MTGRYGQGGAPRQSLFSVIMTPLIITILATGLLIYNLIGLIGVLVNGGEIVYEEETLNAYKTDAYKENFKFEGATGTQNGLTLMFFYNEDLDTVECTYVVGTNIQNSISNLLNSETEGIGAALERHSKVGNYKDTVVANISAAIDEIAESIEELDLINSFVKHYSSKNIGDPAVKVKDESFITQKSADELLPHLVEFEAKTGIPVYVVIDTAVNAFGRTIPVTDILMVVLILLIITLCVVNMVKKIRAYKRVQDDFGGQEANRIQVNARSPYYDEDDEEDEEAEDEEGEIVSSVDEDEYEEDEEEDTEESETEEESDEEAEEESEEETEEELEDEDEEKE